MEAELELELELDVLKDDADLDEELEATFPTANNSDAS